MAFTLNHDEFPNQIFLTPIRSHKMIARNSVSSILSCWWCSPPRCIYNIWTAWRFLAVTFTSKRNRNVRVVRTLISLSRVIEIRRFIEFSEFRNGFYTRIAENSECFCLKEMKRKCQNENCYFNYYCWSSIFGMNKLKIKKIPQRKCCIEQ